MMSYTIAVESFDEITSSWDRLRHCLKWSCIFGLPSWLKAWWEAFGGEDQLYLRTLWDGQRVIGFAPLMVNNETASFIGSPDVCDYLDFVTAPGEESSFFQLLLDDLRNKGIRKLDLRPVRADSTVLKHLLIIARTRGYDVNCSPKDVCLELDLPATWNGYLAMLSSKQRHEVRRKLRRLWEADNVEYHCIEVGSQAEDHLDAFLKLFAFSKDVKASFMDSRMESFFRSVAKAMADIGLLRFGILQVNGIPTAMTMGFDYDDSHYLYNSAYDPQFGYLSVGLLSKVLCLKESIQRGRRKWNFLKGAEPYKYQLGGQEVPLYNCLITIAR
jgi:CelD/BcsL family acetyltransferase involved in cellulose biosynthesis